MEVLIIIIIYFVYKVISNSSSDHNSSNQSVKKEVSNRLEDGLNLKITEKKERIEGVKEEINLFNVKVKGVIYSNLDDNKIAYFLTMTDITEEEKPVLCTLESMQFFKGIFGLQSDLFQIPYKISEVHDWISIFDIPIDVLVFPKKGNRRVKIELSIVNSSEKVVNRSHKIIDFNNKKIGYEDAIEYAGKIKKYSVNFAMYAASIDGHITKDEASIIKKWIINKYSNNELKNNKIQEIISESLAEIKKMKNANYLSSIYDEINSIATNKDKFDMLELILSVTAGDSKFDKDEEKLLEDICNRLDIKREVYNKMASKIIPVNIRENLTNVNKMLGIKESMTKKEKNKVLKQKYREWSSRVNHKDKKIREQAENMLQIIAEEKKKIRNY
jgi:tellurite resistance protein